MRTSVRVHWLPKAGNSVAEYEDACWPRQAGDSSGILRLAVADGATETSFSGLWARLLVNAYGRGRLTEETWEEDLRKIRRVWQRAVRQKPLPWYAEEKLRLGAFAALTGLTLVPPAEPNGGGGTFHAVSMGDSCLFQVRGEQLVCSFPFSSAEEFNSRPLLISSLDRGAGQEIGVQRIGGDWQPDDTFFLMTDALACWALRSFESGSIPFARLASVESPGAFASFIDDERARTDADGIPMLKNDDVTYVGCPQPAG